MPPKRYDALLLCCSGLYVIFTISLYKLLAKLQCGYYVFTGISDEGVYNGMLPLEHVRL